MKTLLQRSLALGCLAHAALGAAQSNPDFNELEVLVTAISGTNVYVDAGRDAGLEPGDTLRFLPVEAAAFETRVDAVSKSSAQIDVGERVLDLRIGDRGVVRIPAGRAARRTQEDQDDVRREAPEHPPWTSTEDLWDDEVPLLAPVESITAEKRESRLRGRIFHGFQNTWDAANEDSRYLTNRTGLDVSIDNPFARADGLRLRTEFYARTAALAGEPDDREQFLRIDRLSYFRGGQRSHPQRFEVGRFLPLEFPEFGILDGVDYSRRLDSGNTIGGSAGLLPQPNDELSSDDDLQASVYYRYAPDSSDSVSFASGFQKTWHKGAPDRDLFVFKGDYRANSNLSLFGTAWVDLYGSSDQIKSSDVELTQLNVASTYRTRDGHGAGLYYTRLRWPELLREEFNALPPEQIRDNRIDRVSLSTWRRLSDHVRVNARVDHWDDQDESGQNGELRLDLSNLLYERGNVSLAVFRIGGAFSAGLGVRGTASKTLESGFLSVSLESTEFDQQDLFGDDDVLRQNALRASYDCNPAGWDVSLFVEDRFGDSQDALTLGFLVQKRF